MRYLPFLMLGIFFAQILFSQDPINKTTLEEKTYTQCAAFFQEGQNLQSAGDLSAAISRFDQATRLALEILPLNSPEVRQCVETLHNALQANGRIEESGTWEGVRDKISRMMRAQEAAAALAEASEESWLDMLKQAYRLYQGQFQSRKIFEALSAPEGMPWISGNHIAASLAGASSLFTDDVAIMKLKYLQAALQTVEASVPLQVPLYQNALAEQYAQLGMEEEALRLSSLAFPGALQTYGESSMSVWSLSNRLTTIYLKQQEYGKALPFTRQKLTTGRLLYQGYQFPPTYPLEGYDQLTAALEGLGEYQEARALYQEAEALLQTIPDRDNYPYYQALIEAGLLRTNAPPGTYAGKDIPLKNHPSLLSQLQQPIMSQPDAYDGSTYQEPLKTMQQVATLWRLGQQQAAKKLFASLDFNFDQQQMGLWGVTRRYAYSSWHSNPGTFPALRQLRRWGNRLGIGEQSKDLSFIFSHCFTDFILCHQHLLSSTDLIILLRQAQLDNQDLFVNMAMNPAHFYDFGKIQNLLNDIVLRNTGTGNNMPEESYRTDSLGSLVLATKEISPQHFTLLKALFFFSVDDLNPDALYDGLSDMLEQEAQYNYIEPYELMVNFIRFPFNGRDGSETDEMRYYALIRKSEPTPDPEKQWGSPEETDFRFIPLCAEKELQQLINKGSGASESVAGLYGQSRGVVSTSTANEGVDPTALYELLWAPLEKEIAQFADIKRIYYVKSGLLNRIPLAPIALPEGGRLIDRYELFPVSTGGFSRGSLGGLNITEWRMQAFGGIDYEKAAETEAANTDLILDQELAQAAIRANGGHKWTYLPGTLEEVELLQERMKQKVQSFSTLTGSDATEEAFKQLEKQDPQPAILHIATHGFFFPEPEDANPTPANNFATAQDPLLRSGLLMAGANRAWQGKPPLPNQEDGILTAREIASLSLGGIELAVLSACETGLGDVNNASEEVFGLQRAFKQAGIRFLIMSLWKVPDLETAEFMNAFYGHLAEGLEIRKAFHQTQREMSRKYPPEKWAAFILMD